MVYSTAKKVTCNKRPVNTFENERQRFYELFSHAPFSMGILKGPDHLYEMANPLYLQLIGKKDIIGKSVKDVLPEIIDQGFIELLDGVYKTGQTFSANELLIKLNYGGSGKMVDRYLNFMCQAYRNIEGTVEGIFFFAIDVTEQVLSRKTIEVSEKKYRQIVETANEGIWVIDENNKTTFVNNKLCKIFEYTQEEMMGRDIYFFMDNEGKEIASESIQKKRKGYSGQRKFKYYSKSGKEIWTYISANPLFDEGGLYKGSLAMITDITDSKKAEEDLIESELRYRSLIQQATEAICITDASLKFIDMNPAACFISGYSKEEFLQLSLPDILFKEDLLTNPVKTNEMEPGKTIWNERRLKKKDGQPIDMEVSTKMLEDGKFIMFGHDISERKKMKR